MLELKEKILRAHGGHRWSEVAEVLACCSVGGFEFLTRLQHKPLRSVDVHLNLQQGRLGFSAYPEPGCTAVFSPGEVWIEDKDNGRLAERRYAGRRASGQWLLWDQLDVLYFVGSWLWQALQLPFLLDAPGVASTGQAAATVGGEHWQRLDVRFPDELAMLAPEQTVYADSTGLIRRIDYAPPSAGPWVKVAQCWEGHESFGGFIYPTRRVIYPCMVTGHLWRLTPLSWLTLDDVSVVRRG